VVINSSKIKFFSILCSHNRQKAFTLKLVQLEKMNYKLSNVSVNPKRGFTLIEVMLVMAIFSLLMGFVTINLLRPQNKASVDSLSTQLIADIKQQQLKAMVGDSEGQATSQQFGVYFESDGYTLFRGSSYSASEASNFEVTLEDVTLTDIDFPSDQIVFSKRSGEVASFSSGSDSVTVNHASSGNTEIITINRYGVISTN